MSSEIGFPTLTNTILCRFDFFPFPKKLTSHNSVQKKDDKVGNKTKHKKKAKERKRVRKKNRNRFAKKVGSLITSD